MASFWNIRQCVTHQRRETVNYPVNCGAGEHNGHRTGGNTYGLTNALVVVEVVPGLPNDRVVAIRGLTGDLRYIHGQKERQISPQSAEEHR